MKIFIVLLIHSFLISSCNTGSHLPDPVIVDLPEMGSIDSSLINQEGMAYDLSHPDKEWKLPKELKEVSGNTFIDENHILLIEDSKPNLYLFNTKNGKVEKTITFAKQEKGQFDIEDVTLVGDIVYALQSHGRIYKIENWKSNPKVTEIKTFLSEKNDVEGICYDKDNNRLLLACKGHSGVKDADKHTKAVYAFDLKTEKLVEKPVLVFKPEDFKAIISRELRFNPSAIGVNPATKEWYLLSTLDNKGMVIFDTHGKLKAYQAINEDLMPQPEGLCFAPDGTLYLSSEAAKEDNGKLFRFNKK